MQESNDAAQNQLPPTKSSEPKPSVPIPMYDPQKLLYTTQFRINKEAGPAIGADHPRAEGGIILIGNYDQTIRANGIRYVVVGQEYVNVIDLLRQRYSQVEIIPWHEAPKKLTTVHNEKTGESIQAAELNDENHPQYQDKRFYPGQIQSANSLEEVVQIPKKAQGNVDIW